MSGVDFWYGEVIPTFTSTWGNKPAARNIYLEIKYLY